MNQVFPLPALSLRYTLLRAIAQREWGTLFISKIENATRRLLSDAQCNKTILCALTYQIFHALRTGSIGTKGAFQNYIIHSLVYFLFSICKRTMAFSSVILKIFDLVYIHELSQLMMDIYITFEV